MLVAARVGPDRGASPGTEGGVHAVRQGRGRSSHLSGTQRRHEVTWPEAVR